MGKPSAGDLDSKIMTCNEENSSVLSPYLSCCLICGQDCLIYTT